MCVIVAWSSGPAPSADTLAACARVNPDGIGAAWRTVEGATRWEKGISLARALEILAATPAPVVLHFRIATVGGAKPALCHPFPVDRGGSGALAGEADTVLFHNGHWAGWTAGLALARKQGHGEAPPGPMSDSRALAWLGAHYGEDSIRRAAVVYGQRVCLLGPDGVRLYGTGWTDRGGVSFSNLNWDRPAGVSWADLLRRDRSAGKALEQLAFPYPRPRAHVRDGRVVAPSRYFPKLGEND